MVAQMLRSNPAKYSSRTQKARKELRLKWLVSIWMAAVLYWPVMRIGGIEFRADYPFLAIMLVWLVMQPKWGRVTRLAVKILLLYVCLLLIGTLNGQLLGYPFNFIGFIGFLTFFVTIVIWAEILRRIPASFVFQLAALLAIPAAILAILQISMPTSVANLTLDWYSSEARTPTVRLFGPMGKYNRAVSVFEAPAYAGVAFLIFSICAWVSAKQANGPKERLFYYATVGFYLIAGLSSASSTYLAGVVILLGLIGARTLTQMRPERWLVFLSGVCVVILGAVVYVQDFGTPAFDSQLQFQLYKLDSGLVFSRFHEGGTVYRNLENWREFFLFGIGGTYSPHMVQDNLYSKLLIDVGILGLFFFVLLLGLLLYNAAKQRKNDFVYGVFMVIMLATAAGLGSPTFMIIRLNEVMAFAIAAGLFLVREGKLGDKE